jgi:hypothetical protein
MRAIKRHIKGRYRSATGNVSGIIKLMHSSGDGGTELILNGANPGFSIGDNVFIDSNGKTFNAGIRSISTNPYEGHLILDAGMDYNKIIYNQMMITGGSVSKQSIASQVIPDVSQAAMAPATQVSNIDTITGDAVDSSATPDGEVSAGMIVPSTQPVQDITPKTINSSSVILLLLLGGVALFGFNKVN